MSWSHRRQRGRPAVDMPRSSAGLGPRYLAILAEAALGADDVRNYICQQSSIWKDVLKNGVFINDKKWFYKLVESRVEDQPKYEDCYFILASYLTFSDQYDSWFRDIETVPNPPKGRVEVKVEVPKLVKSTRWLEVKGNFSTVNLQLYTTYQVFFTVKVWNPRFFPRNDSELPLELSLVLPSLRGRRPETLNCEIITAGQEDWKEVYAGKFSHNYRTMGTMYFSMKNTDATWKGGISVLGVCIKPEIKPENRPENQPDTVVNILQWKPIDSIDDLAKLVEANKNRA